MSHSHTTNSQNETSARTSTKIYNSSNTEITKTGAGGGHTHSLWIGAIGSTLKAHALDWQGNQGNCGKDNDNIEAVADHTHNMQHNHTVDISHTHGTTSNGGNEARPVDYTFKIWKRIA